MSSGSTALVVGIDQYDLDGIPSLTSCRTDALAAVDWLISNGISSENIRLHVSPIEDGEKIYNKVAVRSADHDTILESMTELSKGSGDELFVFLSGHGLFVVGPGAIFLSQDYGVNELTKRNLYIEEYLRWFRSWPYKSQFLFYDACQNLTSTLGSVGPVQADGPQPHPATYASSDENAMVACYSASRGEKAWAGKGDGEGVMIPRVLKLLDPAYLSNLPRTDQAQLAMPYSWVDGHQSLDMRKLFDEIIGPDIQATVLAETKKIQSPYSVQFLRLSEPKASPILQLPKKGTTRITVDVTPPPAHSAIYKVRVATSTPQSSHFELCPVFPLTYFALPDVVIDASCELFPGAVWRASNSPQTKATANADETIDFLLEERPPVSPPPPPNSDFINIRVATANGVEAPVLTNEYSAIAEENGFDKLNLPGGVSFRRHEIGPDIGFDRSVPGAEEGAVQVGTSWLRAIRRHVRMGGVDDSLGDLTVFLSPLGFDEEALKPNLQFRMPADGAWALGGFLRDEDVVTIQSFDTAQPPRLLSLNEIEGHGSEWLQPGLYRVQVTLPWGGWSQNVEVDSPDKPAVVELPSTIGQPPLRNRLSHGLEYVPEGLSVYGLDVSSPHMALYHPTRRRDSGRVNVVVADNGRLEPYSTLPLPEWDALFTSNRMVSVDNERLKWLLDEKHERRATSTELSLLYLGLAYSAFSQSNLAQTRQLLETIREPLLGNLDVELLDIAQADLDHSVKAEDLRSRLIEVASAVSIGGRPLFFWGLALFDTLARRFELELKPISPQICDTSVLDIPEQAWDHVYREVEIRHIDEFGNVYDDEEWEAYQALKAKDADDDNMQTVTVST